MSLIYSLPKALLKCFFFLPSDLDRRTRRLLIQYILGVALCFHRKNATNLAALYGKHKSSFTRLLARRSFSAKGWIADVAQVLIWRGIPRLAGVPLYLIIDSTFKAKRGRRLGNLQKFRTSAHGPYFFGHCFVTAVIYYNGWLIPVAVKPYLSKAYCKKRRQKFHTQIDLAQQIIAEFLPVLGLQTIVLFDSFFCADKVLGAIRSQGFDYVSVLDRNRIITSTPQHPNIAQRIAQLLKTPRTFSKIAFTHEGRKKQYFMRREVLTISKVGDVVVVFSGKEKTIKKIKALVSNMTDLTAVEVSLHYSYRWMIECFFKILKQYLGLGDYQVRSVRAQGRHVQFVVLTYLMLLTFHIAIVSAATPGQKLSPPRSFKRLLLTFRQYVEAENLRLVERKLQSKNGVKFLRRVYKRLREKVA